ncbi:unnamed protein product, partial [Polarella glacialis]
GCTVPRASRTVRLHRAGGSWVRSWARSGRKTYRGPGGSSSSTSGDAQGATLEQAPQCRVEECWKHCRSAGTALLEQKQALHCRVEECKSSPAWWGQKDSGFIFGCQVARVRGGTVRLRLIQLRSP